MEPQTVVSREEAVGLIFLVADILEEVRMIRQLLQDDEDGEEVQEGLE